MSRQLIVKNKKAYYNFEILTEFEAGMVLLGTEVKSLREHRANLKESFARIRNGEVWLENCHISPFSHGNLFNHKPTRSRKLLLHRREISKIIGQVTQKGRTIVPLALYFKGGKAKVKLGIAKGKRAYDKREIRRQRVIEREIQAELKGRNR